MAKCRCPTHLVPTMPASVLSVVLAGLLIAGLPHPTFSASGWRKQEPIIRSPVFISVVIPAVELKRQRLEMVATIPDAYSLWGRAIPSMIPQHKAYFPAPLSYPYQYTNHGLATLQQELRDNVEVEPSWVGAQRLSQNILKAHQEAFEPSELKHAIINERYVSFRFKAMA